MQRDVKIGIAIGVLLIALIAVFWWFRHTNANRPIIEPGATATESEFPGPVVPVAPPVGAPREPGAAVAATAAAPMMTGSEAVGTTTMPAVAAVPPPPPVAASQTYKVQHEDTLSSISEHFYKTTAKWKLIYDANKDKIGSDPNKLKDGMELVIPGVAATPGPSAPPPPAKARAGAAATGGKYVIAAGDSLTSIAQKEYGSATKADVDRIYRANRAKIGDDPDNLKPGIELVIPPAH